MPFVSTMQVVDKPYNSPHNCAVCGAAEYAERAWYLDTGLTFDFDGTVYLCNECCLTVAVTLKWLTAEQVSELRTDLERKIQENEKDIRELQILREFLKKQGIEPEALVRLSETKVPSVRQLKLSERLSSTDLGETIRDFERTVAESTPSNPEASTASGSTDGDSPAAGNVFNLEL